MSVRERDCFFLNCTKSRIVSYLLQTPQGASIEDIAAAAGSRSRGSLHVQLHQIRRHMKAYGYRLTKAYQGKAIKLEPIDV